MALRWTLLALASGVAAELEMMIIFTESRSALGSCNPGDACESEGTCCTQGLSLSEIHVKSGSTELPITSITNPEGYYSSSEPPTDLTDGILDGSKWLDKNFTNVHRTGGYSDAYGQTTLLLTVDDSSGTPDMLDFFTGSNPNKRDPVSWTVYYKNACGGWSEMNSATQFDVPTARWTSFGSSGVDITLSPPATLTASDCEKSSIIRFTFTGVLGPDVDGIQLSEVRAHPPPQRGRSQARCPLHGCPRAPPPQRTAPPPLQPTRPRRAHASQLKHARAQRCCSWAAAA